MESKPYEPELGQMCFGNPTGEYECSVEIGVLLEAIGALIELTTGTVDPTGNNGAEYKNDTFEMRSYYWGEDEAMQDAPNFKYGDIEIRWYKYCHRGMSANFCITNEMAVDMFRACVASVVE